MSLCFFNELCKLWVQAETNELANWQLAIWANWQLAQIANSFPSSVPETKMPDGNELQVQRK